MTNTVKVEIKETVDELKELIEQADDIKALYMDSREI